MKTEILQANFALDKETATESTKKAAKVIKEGGLVAFPTETVYGLGANAFDEAAVSSIFKAKDRPEDKALIVHISSADQIKEVAEKIPSQAYILAGAFWPGPLTLVLKKKADVPDVTTGGNSTVAVRMPNNETARNLIEMSGCLIAAPSANISGQRSPKTAGAVKEQLNNKIDVILDGGETTIQGESTIVDLSGGEIRILRHGAIPDYKVFEVLHPISEPKTLLRTDIRRVIFVDRNGITRAPMAAALFEREYNGDMEILCRGLTVSFPEPLNQKTEAVMISNGINLENFSSEQMTDSDITPGAYIFVMEERDRKKVLRDFKHANENNTFLLSSFVGDELEIMDPYGGTLQMYGICFEVIRNTIERMLDENETSGSR